MFDYFFPSVFFITLVFCFVVFQKKRLRRKSILGLQHGYNNNFQLFRPHHNSVNASKGLCFPYTNSFTTISFEKKGTLTNKHIHYLAEIQQDLT